MSDAAQRDPPPRSVDPSTQLDSLQWKELAEASDPTRLAGAWLAIQCGMVDGAREAAVWHFPQGELGRPAAQWPPDAALSDELLRTAQRAVEVGQGIAHRIRSPETARATEADDAGSVLAYPLIADGNVVGVVAIRTTAAEPARLATAMRQVQWGSAWIRESLLESASASDGSVLERTTAALDVMAAVLERDGLLPSCHVAVSSLATRTHCDRVSVGFVRKGRAVVRAISHSAEFGERMNVVRQIEAAMDEAIGQHAILVHPPPPVGEPVTLQAHADLATAHGGRVVLTVPLLAGGEAIGAIVCERPTSRPFDQDAVDLVAAVAALLGPVLEEKRNNDRWLAAKIVESVATHAGDLVGPEHTLLKLVTAGLIAVLLFGLLATGRDRVTADARIQGRVQRSIVAPFDGYVEKASVRAGDLVEKGQLIAAMDDRDLVLERLRWLTERDNKRHEFERALSERNRAETNVIRTEIARAEAQMKLIDEQLTRAALIAPFDGIVVSGDLSQAIGAAVGRGDTLFELAPLDEYRVVLNVDEGRVADLETGQKGELIVSALPGRALDVVVETITPVATVEDGRNVFRVEAILEADTSRLRPGMEGIAKIDTGVSRLVWIWSRPAVDWLRMSIWRWMP